METTYFDLKNGERTIKCKIIRQSDKEVSGVVLGIHGFCGDKESSMLSELAEGLFIAGAAVVCFDLPTHGDSPEGEEALTVKNCIDDIVFMADWCRKNFKCPYRAVFATSFGGFLALNCISELNGFHMILRAPAVTMPEHILLDILGMSAEEFKKAGSAEVGFERKINLPYKFYEELCEYSLAGKSFDKPVFIIHGDMDDVVPYSDIVEFCENNPTMKLSVINGADHRFKRPQDFEKIISRTLVYLLDVWDRIW